MSTATFKQKFSLIISSIFLGLITVGGIAYAGAGDNVAGWGWGGGVSVNPAGYQGMGWISFNSSDCDTDNNGVADVAGCGGTISNYGVNFPSGNGNITGHAWSEHYGWISFNGADLAGCAPAMAQANRTGNALQGGARILAIRDAVVAGNAGGYDGCIDLSYATVDATNSTLNGHFWSSDLGWIDVDLVQVGVPIVNLELEDTPGVWVNGDAGPITSKREPSDLNLRWTSTDAASCNSSWSGVVGVNSNDTISGVGRGTHVYTLTCTNSNGASQTDSITVIIPTPVSGLSVTGCSIPENQSTCSVDIEWDYENATPDYEVKRVSGPTYYNGPSDALGTDSELLQVGTYTFTASHNNGDLLPPSITRTIACADPLGKGIIPNATNGNMCQDPPDAPDIDMTPKPDLIRKGDVATIEVRVDSVEDLTCRVLGSHVPPDHTIDISSGGDVFYHKGLTSGVTINTYTITTRALSNAQTVQVECVVDWFTSVKTTKSTQIRVVGTQEEI